jgi:hypothetical protein
MVLLALALVTLYFLLPAISQKYPRNDSQNKPRVDYTIGARCVVVTEMTGAGRALPAPSTDKPVYFIPHSVGQRYVGDGYGGTKQISADPLQKQLDTAFASKGYRRSDPAGTKNPPTQVIFFSWGMHNKMEYMPGGQHGGNIDDIIGNLNFTDINTDTNLLSRAKTIGGQKFAVEFAAALAGQVTWQAGRGNTASETNSPLRRFAGRDPAIRMLVHAILDDCHYMLVYSFDAEALKRGERRILWTTRISTTPRGDSLEAALPGMIDLAAHFFGRETPPKIVRKKEPKTEGAPK